MDQIKGSSTQIIKKISIFILSSLTVQVSGFPLRLPLQGSFWLVYHEESLLLMGVCGVLQVYKGGESREPLL